MLWEEDEEQPERLAAPDEVVDLAFRVQCKSLPFDHAYALSQALTQKLPWLPDDARAGIHLIQGAESGNGWIRGDQPDDLVYLSRRTRFYLRVPSERSAEAMELVGARLHVGGNEMVLGECQVRPLSVLTTLSAKYVLIPGADESEESFLQGALKLLQGGGIRVKKMLSGRSHLFRFPSGVVHTRSLMVDGLSVEDSLKLQRDGLGPSRHFGFGIFLPHKGIDAVRQPEKK